MTTEGWNYYDYAGYDEVAGRTEFRRKANKKEAVRELADVFEWLKKTKGLATVLDGKEESAIFDLANNFAIRHHNPKQKTS